LIRNFLTSFPLKTLLLFKLRILKPSIQATENFGTQLLIMNRIFPNGLDTMPRENEKILRNLDLIVFMLSGGGKKSASHSEGILRMADERLAIKRSIRSFNLLFSFVEVSLNKQLLGTTGSNVGKFSSLYGDTNVAFVSNHFLL